MFILSMQQFTENEYLTSRTSFILNQKESVKRRSVVVACTKHTSIPQNQIYIHDSIYFGPSAYTDQSKSKTR